MERLFKDLSDTDLREKKYSLMTLMVIAIGDEKETADVKRLMNQVNYEIMCRAEKEHGKRHTIMKLKSHFERKVAKDLQLEGWLIDEEEEVDSI